MIVAFLMGSVCSHRSYTTVNHSPFKTNPKISNSDFLTDSEFLKLRTGRKIIFFSCSKFKVIYRNENNEKVCHTHDLGSYAQGQGRDQVRGQNRVSAITQKLLKQILRNFTER